VWFILAVSESSKATVRGKQNQLGSGVPAKRVKKSKSSGNEETQAYQPESGK
jgi:hypothetical protein